MATRAQGSQFTGVCKFWNVPKGCGFLTADDGGQDLFVSQHDLVTGDNRFRALLPNQRVDCIYTLVDNGKAIGKQVTGTNGQPLPSFKDMYTAKREIEANKAPDPNKNYGTIKWFNVQKNFGFIIPSGGGEDVFFHFSECIKGIVPMDGDSIEYCMKTDKSGKSIGAKVKNKTQKKPKPQINNMGPYAQPVPFTTQMYGHPAMVAAYGKRTGIVKFFDEAKGYGFIIPDLGGRDVHVHKSNIFGGELNKDDVVEYQEELVNGKVQAVAVSRKRNNTAHAPQQIQQDYNKQRTQRVVYDMPQQQQAQTPYANHGGAETYQYFDPSALSTGAPRYY